MVSGDGDSVTANSANSNGHDGIEVGGGLVPSVLEKNTATLNGNAGIEIESGVAGDTIVSNTAKGNSTDLKDANIPTCQNAWASNTFVSDNESDILYGPSFGCIR